MKIKLGLLCKDINITIDKLYDCLIKDKNNINKYCYDYTPLMHLCENINVNIHMLKLMIENNANPDLLNNKNDHALMILCKNKSINREMFEYLLNVTKNINIINNVQNNILLCLYNYNENFITCDILNLLKNKNLNFNIKDQIGRDILIYLCCSSCNNFLDLIEYILKNTNINLNNVDNNNISAFIYLCYKLPEYNDNIIDILQLFIDLNISIFYNNNYLKHNTYSILCNLAINKNNIKLLKFIIKNIKDIKNINHTDSFGDTLLLKCMHNSNINIDIIKILIDSGINIHIRNNMLETAMLNMCYFSVSIELYELMFNNGAKCIDCDKNNYSTLMYLCLNKKITIDLLVYFINKIKKYYNKSIKDYYDFINLSAIDKKTAFIILCNNNNVTYEMIVFMIENGADVNNIEYKNNTALFNICTNEYINKIDKLEIINYIKRYIKDDNIKEEIKRINMIEAKDEDEYGYMYMTLEYKNEIIYELEKLCSDTKSARKI